MRVLICGGRDLDDASGGWFNRISEYNDQYGPFTSASFMAEREALMRWRGRGRNIIIYRAKFSRLTGSGTAKRLGRSETVEC